jgi:hypothetical protein
LQTVFARETVRENGTEQLQSVGLIWQVLSHDMHVLAYANSKEMHCRVHKPCSLRMPRLTGSNDRSETWKSESSFNLNPPFQGQFRLHNFCLKL